MAFTGDLEHLNIVDIIQLVHATRQSGIFSVKGTNGESTIVFKNGQIVGANYCDNNVRIGTILVKTGAIAIDALKQAMVAMKNADDNRMPLLTTLVRMGKLKQEDAVRGLKKLVELTIVELMSLTKGTFTFDTDAVVVSPDGDQDLGVDAQMVLMDALRISDERERDRREGKDVPSFTALYPDVLPGEGAGEAKGDPPAVTADDLGLADLDRLEKKIPRPVSEMEIFDPAAMHRRTIKELLPGFSYDEQEAFFSFIRKFPDPKAGPDAEKKHAGKAIVMFSNDALITHSIMSLCNDEGVLVFATDDEKELDRMVSQCLLSARMPVVVFDNPVATQGAFSRENITGIRNAIRAKYSTVPVLQFSSPQDSDFILQSYSDGVRAVLPRPSKEDRRQTYIQDTIRFLDAFRSHVRSLQYGQDDADLYGRKLKDGITSLRTITNPADAALVVLTAVSEMFERAVTLLVRASELVGERAIGVSSVKSLGPAPAGNLRVPLSQPSVFRDVIEKGRVYYGERGDETLRTFFMDLGNPLSPAIVLLPLICDKKVVAMIYGDFGQKGAAPVRIDMLEILAQHAGVVLEYAVFRRQVSKAAQKS
jgi:DNA-binding NarL/FixJ family response regulator